MSTHPAPHRHRTSLWELGFALTGGCIAWGVQFCASFAVASLACFDAGERSHQAERHAQPVILWITIACLLVALAATGVSWLVWRRTREEAEGGHRELLEKGGGRTRFLSLWGLLLGLGSALTILANLIGLLLVPPCAG
ncbi:hypothetical protein [Sphingomonas quercus]|uniref:Uncharacterized protein n=1 Tax=Sphingomonas quercus TaxID=2842451 RepID=A0ABS6BM03_9SPHN|nr:hypothetical protein [Sphingomonas quercus]MBU3079349.1 hypothetical protein [Sphingomonas quercus]